MNGVPAVLLAGPAARLRWVARLVPGSWVPGRRWRAAGGVDYLVNDAGRSIRRSIASSYDRMHGDEPTMDLDHLGAVRFDDGAAAGDGRPGVRPRGQRLNWGVLAPRLADALFHGVDRMFPEARAARRHLDD